MTDTGEPRNFCFVLNRVEFDGSLPFELIAGHFLNRATEAQQNVIRRFLGNRTEFGMHTGWYDMFRNDGGKVTLLPPEQQRYWVVNFTGVPKVIRTLKGALSLNVAELELGFAMLPDESSIHYHPGEMAQFYLNWEHMRQPVPRIDTRSLEDVRVLHKRICDIESTHPSIASSLTDFQSIRSLPRDSRFAALGYFMVLESLLTHNPAGASDGLTHQVSTKMPLMEKRFEAPLGYSVFQPTTSKKIWSQLYSYRSAIAHGGTPDFKQNMKALRNDSTVIAFMRNAVRLLLIEAIKEPVLLTDLRDV